MSAASQDDIRAEVRLKYGQIAEREVSGCCGPSDCGTTGSVSSTSMGYSSEERTAAPDGADLGLGCGNPQLFASLKHGETVLDLGSGGGFDCFLAAQSVGKSGRVIGVDMTPEMIALSRRNAREAIVGNVQFRLGEIEHLPVADDSVDVVISNCVINLSPDKKQVFSDVFRVLKPGGRLAISDIVATAELPEEMHRDLALYVGCVAGASPASEIQSILHGAGFIDIEIRANEDSRSLIREWAPDSNVDQYVASAMIEATKPA